MLFLNAQRWPITLALASVVFVASHNVCLSAPPLQGAPVLSVTSESIKATERPEICTPTILTAQQIAQREEDSKTWMEKNWIPVLGGVAGLAIGIPISNYVASVTSTALVVPTVLIVGGAGFFLTKMLMPVNPLLTPPKPGSFLAEQNFYFETTCKPGPVKYQEIPHYRITYRFNGKVQSALVKYDPGERITLNAQGRPINEIAAADNNKKN
ncbi:MAG: hypothetical protein RI904_581 [Pseudomonadota bacterium]